MDDFSARLAHARRKAGLSQADIAHLLGISQAQVSRLELGRAVPTIRDVCGVAVLFGRSMELLVEPLFLERALGIRERLVDLPEQRTRWLADFVRQTSLRKLEQRVERIATHYDPDR